MNYHSDNLYFLESKMSYVVKETSTENQIKYFKSLIGLAIKAIDIDIINYFLSQKVRDAIIDATTLAEVILLEDNPTLKEPVSKKSFIELIEWINPCDIDPFFDDEEDVCMGNQLRRRWLFSFLWTIQCAIDDWVMCLTRLNNK